MKIEYVVMIVLLLLAFIISGWEAAQNPNGLPAVFYRAYLK